MSKNCFIAAFATLVCAISIGGFITARAQSITYILFVLEILFIENFLESGKKKYLIGLLIISLAICNMHVAVWPFYYIIYIPYLVEYLFSIIFKKLKLKKIIIEKNDNIKLLFITMLVSLLTGLLTPIDTTPYTYFIKTSLGNSQKYIKEHQMITWLYSPFTIIITLETFLLALLSKIKLRDLFMICGLVIMSIISIRHIALLALIGSICFGRVFTLFIEHFDLKIDDIIIPILSKKIIYIIAFIIVIAFSIFMLNIQQKKDFIDEKAYPVEAVKYIKENIDTKKMRVFNEYNFGSYLILNNIPVFIDSRADLYTKQFSGFEYDIFDDWKNISIDWKNKFAFYNITHVLIYKENDEWFCTLLNNDGHYKILYEDDNFILYEKTN